MLKVLSVSPTGSLPVVNDPPNFPSHNSHTVIGNNTPYSIHCNTPPNVDATTSSNAYDDGDASNPPDVEVFVQTPLQLGKTLIVYHPHAQHPPEIVDTTTLSLTCEPQSSFLPEEPWAPFKSHGDFEQAELFVKHNCTNRLINDQLHLNQKQDSQDRGPGDPPLMRNAY